MKNIFKEAHKIAREIKREYPEVDYKAQFGICLSYLLNNREEEVMDNKKVYDFGQFKIITEWNKEVVYKVEFEGNTVKAKIKYGKMKGENITYLQANDINKNILIKGCGINRTEIFNFKNELVQALAEKLTMKDVKTRKEQGRIFNTVKIDSKFKGLETEVAEMIIDNDVKIKATIDEVPVGYFRCWECGSIEPLNKKQVDGTCGC